MSDGEFERATGDGAYEWSVPSGEDQGRHYRLFVAVEADLSRSIQLEDSPVTSASPGARRMTVDGDAGRSLAITLEAARWLLETLPKAIAKVEATWREPAPSGTPEAGAR